ncbi:MAG: hypothetical protein MHMPM18_003142, partial [Marteilia pararefringens]
MPDSEASTKLDIILQILNTMRHNDSAAGSTAITRRLKISKLVENLTTKLMNHSRKTMKKQLEKNKATFLAAISSIVAKKGDMFDEEYESLGICVEIMTGVINRIIRQLKILKDSRALSTSQNPSLSTKSTQTIILMEKETHHKSIMISPDVLNKASQTEYKHNLHPRTISIFGKLNSKLEILKKRQIFFHQKFKGIVDSIRNSLDELNAKFLVDFQELFERDKILLEHLKAFESIRLKNDDRDQHRISEFYRKILLDLKKDFKSKLEA